MDEARSSKVVASSDRLNAVEDKRQNRLRLLHLRRSRYVLLATFGARAAHVMRLRPVGHGKTEDMRRMKLTAALQVAASRSRTTWVWNRRST